MNVKDKRRSGKEVEAPINLGKLVVMSHVVVCLCVCLSHMDLFLLL